MDIMLYTKGQSRYMTFHNSSIYSIQSYPSSHSPISIPGRARGKGGARPGDEGIS